MAANTVPIMVLTPSNKLVQMTAANTNRDGTTGTYYELCVGTTNGTRVKKITAKCSVTSVAGMIRLFYYDGTNKYLWREEPTGAATPAATVQGASVEILPKSGDPNDDLVTLPSGHKIYGSTEKAETWNMVSETWDY